MNRQHRSQIVDQFYDAKNEKPLAPGQSPTRMVVYTDSISCSTGFGQVAKNILMGIYKSGRYGIAQFGINYWGEPHEYPIDIFPMGINRDNDPYGRKKFAELAMGLDYDLLFCSQDSFILMILKELVPQLRNKGKNAPVVAYFPIDGVPKPQWIEGTSAADHLITYSQWGKEMAISQYPPLAMRDVEIIPLGINLNHFHPLEEKEIKEFRRGYFKSQADRFIFTVVARNQQRKDLTRALRAFKEVKKQRPDSLLYMHMAMDDLGWKLGECCKSLGLNISTDVIFPSKFNINKGFPVQVLNLLYNASDCVISTALGEGWGLSQTEAMATKVPVIMPNNTVHPEICNFGERGLLVDAGGDPDHEIIITNDFEVLRPAVHVSDMIEKMVWMFDNRGSEEVNTMVEKGYEYVVKELDWNKVIPRFLKIFDRAVSEGIKASAVTADLL
jgi:glycosyltransferase involved in cell wall biosynthesis